MAKRTVPLYKLSFDGIVAADFITTINSVGRGEGRNCFIMTGPTEPCSLLHTELCWMRALTLTGRIELRIIRDEIHDKRSIHIHDNTGEFQGELELDSYVTIKDTEDQIYLELEELNDGKWRLTHTKGILPRFISGATAIILEKHT